MTIQYQIQSKASNYTFVASLVLTGVRDSFDLAPVYPLSLPKPFSFNARTISKSGDLRVNAIDFLQVCIVQFLALTLSVMKAQLGGDHL